MTREQENYVSDLCSEHGGHAIVVTPVAEHAEFILVEAPNGDAFLVDEDGNDFPVQRSSRHVAPDDIWRAAASIVEATLRYHLGPSAADVQLDQMRAAIRDACASESVES